MKINNRWFFDIDLIEAKIQSRRSFRNLFLNDKIVYHRALSLVGGMKGITNSIRLSRSAWYCYVSRGPSHRERSLKLILRPFPTQKERFAFEYGSLTDVSGCLAFGNRRFVICLPLLAVALKYAAPHYFDL